MITRPFSKRRTFKPPYGYRVDFNRRATRRRILRALGLELMPRPVARPL